MLELLRDGNTFLQGQQLKAPSAVSFQHRDFSSDSRTGCTSEERWEIIKHSTEVGLDDEGLLNHQRWKEAIWEGKKRTDFLKYRGSTLSKAQRCDCILAKNLFKVSSQPAQGNNCRHCSRSTLLQC